MHREPLDLVPQQLAVVTVLPVVVIVNGLDPGLDQKAQRADGVAAVGSEAGEIDQCRLVSATVIHGGFEHIDRTRGVARTIEHPGTQPGPPDRPLVRGCRGEPGELLDRHTAPPELVPHRSRDRAVIERANHAGDGSRVTGR